MDEDKFLEPITSEKEDEQESLPVYEILTYPADYTLEVLVEKWSKKQILVPTLQRGYVWNQAQRWAVTVVTKPGSHQFATTVWTLSLNQKLLQKKRILHALKD